VLYPVFESGSARGPPGPAGGGGAADDADRVRSLSRLHGGHDYLVRQLADHKAGLEPTELTGRTLLAYAWLCGEVLAKGHARTSDAAMLAGYLGSSPHGLTTRSPSSPRLTQSRRKRTTGASCGGFADERTSRPGNVAVLTQRARNLRGFVEIASISGILISW
jgi:hypothetical protein